MTTVQTAMDMPDTKADPAPTSVVVVPTNWLVLGGNYAELLIQRIDMAVVDFYREAA